MHGSPTSGRLSNGLGLTQRGRQTIFACPGTQVTNATYGDLPGDMPCTLATKPM